MKHRLLLILALVVLLVPVSVSYADTGLDDRGNANDPVVNARANACFEGGVMAGKCDTEWEWTCGWYLIRYNVGLFSRRQVPATCASLLPVSKTYPVAGCVLFIPAQIITPTARYINFNGGNFLSNPIPIYSDTACSVGVGTQGAPTIYAPNGAADALDICRSHGYTSANKQFFYAPAIYDCS